MLSICIFGSQARRTADALSDRDVLLVGLPSPSLDLAVTEWSVRNWNVSILDPRALERLAEVKALFIQHLKQEGDLIHDDGHFLASIFSKYLPKLDYSAERNDAISQISSLPEDSGIYWRDLCLADIAYVLFRNASILHLACDGEYQFQYDALVTRMADLFELNKQDQHALLFLRDLKHGYRRRDRGLTVREPLQQSLRVLDLIAERLPNRTTSSIGIGATTDDYFKLRLTELDLVTVSDPEVLDALRADSVNFAVWERIRRSGGYPKPGARLH
jgi:hypothetical protein